MSTTTNQPTNQAPTPAQELRQRLERSLTVNGEPADRETINRIVSASMRPQPTVAPRGCLQTKPFSLLR